MDEKSSYILVAAFGNSEQLRFADCGILSRHKPKKGGEFSAAFED
jgi:hypothetical protein